MPAEYLFGKVDDTELMDDFLNSIIYGSNVTSRASSNKFISYGDGIVDNGFYLGNMVTDYIDKITINNLTSYILSIPKRGAYSVNDTKREELSIIGNSGVLALPSETIIYDSPTETIEDYTIIINSKELDSAIEKKYDVPDFGTNMLALNLKSDQVNACFQFIESTLNMLRSFPDARNSELVKKNLKEIATFMLIDIIAESTKAKSIVNLNPEKYLVSKAEEIMEAECKKLFTIQEVADKVFTSPRNLQMAFKRYRNYSPMQFLKNQKLHLVRKILLESKGQRYLVKQAAHDAGIFDLNRFSQQYAKVFGELPNETLKNN